MANEGEGVDGGGREEVFVRLRGRAAARFLALHKKLTESDDLDHIKLGDMSLSALGAYGLCEWMAETEKMLDGGGRR